MAARDRRASGSGPAEEMMDRHRARLELAAMADALAAARDAAPDEAAKAAAGEAIARLESARRRLAIATADALGAQVDQLIAELEKLLARHGAEAVPALPAIVVRLQELRREDG